MNKPTGQEMCALTLNVTAYEDPPKNQAAVSLFQLLSLGFRFKILLKVVKSCGKHGEKRLFDFLSGVDGLPGL